ncbi:hypothetical protein SCB29_10705 [Paraburkholderia sp. SIMBA_055]|jgi:4-amino-4-deoxy-L-arabinose transferase-like glycosyltransferase|uniref:Uncharacterized protein n=2 Tax=Paraburkholderia graminis TaxID=60548 RepID=B1G2H5_PARG4|nr:MULTISPECIES: hypothetical protein [Paraburkholderia]ALE55681.1 membrane protein [Burkholderia sp. HB1]AXF08912.1 hypothetical protein CUJ91_14075 [Paraburkholderia graminis]EDT09546.1 conserved hypothetical protein [Paraburkholderia graminis C4D1M]MDQ0624149.1 4-amino-4-deoxy-L-arabinose transferase-like glycosyltransferase [Paraburkholderia graminis]MDR6202894.1 4-amino-4-deoxy-L-arabinose transferase-like glycosyltransferase [Paraburkholderia graminis]
MIVHNGIMNSYVMVAFVCLGVLLIGGLLIVMRRRHKYDPNLIGALVGAMLCFLLLEALPALT